MLTGEPQKIRLHALNEFLSMRCENFVSSSSERNLLLWTCVLCQCSYSKRQRWIFVYITWHMLSLFTSDECWFRNNCFRVVHIPAGKLQFHAWHVRIIKYAHFLWFCIKRPFSYSLLGSSPKSSSHSIFCSVKMIPSLLNFLFHIKLVDLSFLL